MQRIIARYVSLMVAATMTLAVSTANAGVDELPADIKNSLYNNNFWTLISQLVKAPIVTG